MIGKIVNIDGYGDKEYFEILDKILVPSNGCPTTKYICVSTNKQERNFVLIVNPNIIYFTRIPKEVVI